MRNGTAVPERYWEVYYDLDFDHTAKYFEERIEALLAESVKLHLRSDVPVARVSQRRPRLLSVASLASRGVARADEGVHRALPRGRALRREPTTRAMLAGERGLDLHQVDIDVDDFLGSIESVIYHLDYPVAGPGSFPQYMVSRGGRRATRR